MMAVMRGLGPLFLPLLLLVAKPASSSWNPRLAAQYLDQRQQAWFQWPAAKAATGGNCFSCHTNATYLLARPALRRLLHETEPTPAEQQLRASLRDRLDTTDATRIKKGMTAEPTASQAIGVESIFAALFLRDPESSRKAFDRLWPLEISEGPDRGAWQWFNLDAEPYEMPPSKFFGAALAVRAVGDVPPEYRKLPEVREHIAAMAAYFSRTCDAQPLHNQLMLLWA